MQSIHAVEVLEAVYAERGEVWDGFATGLDALALYQWLQRFATAPLPVFPLMFICPDVWWSEDFFAVLIGMMSEDENHEWMGQLVLHGDLGDDPTLVDLCREAVARGDQVA